MGESPGPGIHKEERIEEEMIPDFKTYVRESVWNDIRKQSAGRQMRTEDDINGLNEDEFLIYLQEHYQVKNTQYDMRITNHDSIACPIYRHSPVTTVFMFYLYMEHKVCIHKDCMPIYTPELYERVKENFDCCLNGNENRYINIDPVDGEPVTNTFLLKVIDFINDNLGEDEMQTMFKIGE